MTVPEILDELEAFYGPQQPASPTDPYEFLIWWHCGYPASDAACARGWKALQSSIGIAPEQILKASHAALAAALKAGGMVPELRAQRLQQIAERIQQECHGDLLTALAGPPEAARKLLKKFPNIADPGDRILLFANLSPIAAVPSNCPQVLVRIRLGLERENYNVTYREAQELIEAEAGKAFAARKRAYLLLKQHGQQLCKRTKPKCDQCPLRSACQYAARNDRGGKR